MDSQDAPPAGAHEGSIHIFFFPHSARGHTIPLLHTARLFAQRPGVRCTFVTTPGNSSYILPAIEDAKSFGLPLDLLLIPFPATEVGLPAGLECTDALPHGDADIQHKHGLAQFLLRHPFKALVAEHRPDCIVSDCIAFWNAGVAGSLSVPHFVFSIIPPSAKSVADNLHMMMMSRADAAADTGDHVGPLTGLPHEVELTRAELPVSLRLPAWLEMLADAERKSLGIIFNTFYELEPEYVDHYVRTNLTGTTMKVFCVGPVNLYKNVGAAAAAANEFEKDCAREINDWLNSKEPESVLYVSFGSECFFTSEQLREIAVGLQSCKHCFVWVVRRGGGGGDAIDEWLPGEFHETVGNRGLILTEWAPQVAILNHRATGGFVTHCGWNSVMEAVCAGLPVIAWPLHSEQFLNERLLVEILGLGLRILDGPGMRSVDAEGKGLVKGEQIMDAVDRLMAMGGRDEEARAMRRMNAGKYQELAKSAMEEGGSSYVNLSSVIELIKEEKKEKQKLKN